MVDWRNTQTHYGLVAVASHWVTALTVFALFALGLWMTGLSYYDPWYRAAPDIHRGVGILLALLVVGRLVWRLANPQPLPQPGHARWERRTAQAVHLVLYLLMFVMFASGYLITTAEGQSISVFGWFTIPAVVTSEGLGVTNLEDIAGDVHEISSFILVGLGIIHGVAALKHHVVDRDNTLYRMLARDRRAP